MFAFRTYSTVAQHQCPRTVRQGHGGKDASQFPAVPLALCRNFGVDSLYIRERFKEYRRNMRRIGYQSVVLLRQLSPDCIYLEDSTGNTVISSHIVAYASYEPYLFFQRCDIPSSAEQGDIWYYILQTDTQDVKAAASEEAFGIICDQLGIHTNMEWTETSDLTSGWFSSPRNSMTVCFWLSVCVCLLLMGGIFLIIRSKSGLHTAVRIGIAAILCFALIFMLLLTVCLTYFLV